MLFRIRATPAIPLQHHLLPVKLIQRIGLPIGIRSGERRRSGTDLQLLRKHGSGRRKRNAKQQRRQHRREPRKTIPGNHIEPPVLALFPKFAFVFLLPFPRRIQVSKPLANCDHLHHLVASFAALTAASVAFAAEAAAPVASSLLTWSITMPGVSASGKSTGASAELDAYNA
jgi:hypothetical protein